VIFEDVFPLSVVKEVLLPPTLAVVGIFVIPVPDPIFALVILDELPAEPELVHIFVVSL
jgi:hypothetical protein